MTHAQRGTISPAPQTAPANSNVHPGAGLARSEESLH
jgi:hypothetical protein